MHTEIVRQHGTDMATLASRLAYEPRNLAFGTSGRRGFVHDLTQMELYICATAELRFLQSLPIDKGGIVPGNPFFFAADLRPSSTDFVGSDPVRGEIAQAIVHAIQDAGMHPIDCGHIPTPALASYALSHGKGSMMITGSHIPFDRNGYKTNTSRGELLKEHEAPILKFVERVRREVYEQPFTDSPFDEYGMLKQGHCDLPPVSPHAAEAYRQRYLDFFAGCSMSGMRILLYQHSAVGRDLLVDLLRTLGAEVIPAGRSSEFVPIDTENIDAARVAAVQALAGEAARLYGPLEAVVSTDGDSDRPLLLAVDQGTGRVRFFGGDLIGMLVAEYLDAEAVVVPISCNDSIDRGPLASRLAPKTRIGSPYVIAGMAAALASGKQRVCGWEANGGFLTGSPFERNGRRLAALPTRDAVLPLLCVLFSAREKQVGVCDLFQTLPRRFSRAGLLPQFPRHVALRILDSFTCPGASLSQVEFIGSEVLVQEGQSESRIAEENLARELSLIRDSLAVYFSMDDNFGSVTTLNYVDGLRITFSNGDVAHLRPSGNADELRIYAVSDTVERADQIVSLALVEPMGILRRLESAALGDRCCSRP